MRPSHGTAGQQVVPVSSASTRARLVLVAPFILTTHPFACAVFVCGCPSTPAPDYKCTKCDSCDAATTTEQKSCTHTHNRECRCKAGHEGMQLSNRINSCSACASGKYKSDGTWQSCKACRSCDAASGAEARAAISARYAAHHVAKSMASLVLDDAHARCLVVAAPISGGRRCFLQTYPPRLAARLLQVKTTCSTTANAECKCKDGFYGIDHTSATGKCTPCSHHCETNDKRRLATTKTSDGKCPWYSNAATRAKHGDVCIAWSDCPVGEGRVGGSGSATEDLKCEKCEGTQHSSSSSIAVCAEHAQCGPRSALVFHLRSPDKSPHTSLRCALVAHANMRERRTISDPYLPILCCVCSAHQALAAGSSTPARRSRAAASSARG